MENIIGGMERTVYYNDGVPVTGLSTMGINLTVHPVAKDAPKTLILP